MSEEDKRRAERDLVHDHDREASGSCNELGGGPGVCFTCANCGGVFIRTRTDEEALAESVEMFGETPNEDRVLICDHCHHALLARMAQNQVMSSWLEGENVGDTN